jgi:hypothetical protein
MSDSDRNSFEDILEEFLEQRGWTDELEADEEGVAFTLKTGIDIGDQTGKLIVEASDQTELVGVYIYYNIRCKETKLEQMALLLNRIHAREHYGRFQCFDDGFVRWMHLVDFEGSTPSWRSVQQIVGPGWQLASKWLDAIAAVALTRQTATEALEEHDALEQARERAEEAEAAAEDGGEGEAERDTPREL